MAKIKVREAFIDAHTGALHPDGEVFEADEKRIGEIQSVNADLITVITEKDSAKSRKKVDK